ncbi:MAG: HupE/UreJ family protein, partial [Pirellulaceae bacterium]
MRDFIDIYENGQLLPTPRFVGARVSLPADRSFESYEQALAHTIGTDLPLDTPIRWDEGVLDVAYEYPIQSADSDFSINPGLTRLGLQVNIGLRFFTADGTEHAFDVHPEVGIVQLDPSWTQAFYFFAREGFFHILSGSDHLLFLFALVIPFRRLIPLAGVATAFTVGHSITLISSALGLAPTNDWFPYIIEMLIALSILYMALENIVGATIERRWWVALAFGMVHGFGFSFLLTERLQFAGSHLLTSLLAFNVGVELGQLVFLTVAVSGLTFLFRVAVPVRVGSILLSTFVAHTAWTWTVDRRTTLAGLPAPSWSEVFESGALVWGGAVA